MIIDILIGAVLLISAIISFLRGFIREVLTILGVVCGFFAAYFGADYILPYVYDWFGIEEGEEVKKLFDVVPYTLIAEAVTYASIFIFIVILVSLISHVISESLKNIGLGAIDRTLGVVFGLVRGVLLLGLIYLLPYTLLDNETKARWFEGSRSFVYLEQTSALILSVLPDAPEGDDDSGDSDEARKDQTREMLENMDLLPAAKKGLEQIQNMIPEEESSEQPDVREDIAPGYTDQFRDNMDRLIEQEIETVPKDQGTLD